MRDEFRGNESAEVATTRQYIAETLTRAIEELSGGKYLETRAPYEKGDLTVDTVLSTIASIGDLCEYSAVEARGQGMLSDTIVFEHTDEKDLYIQIRCDGPSVTDTDEIVARSLMVTFKTAGKTQEVPDSTMEVINTERRNGDERLNSIVALRANQSKTGGAMIPNTFTFTSNTIRLVNPELTTYIAESGHYYEDLIAKYEYDKIPPFSNLPQDIQRDRDTGLHHLTTDLIDEAAWGMGTAFISLPNIEGDITSTDVQQLINRLELTAEARDLDITLVFYKSGQELMDDYSSGETFLGPAKGKQVKVVVCGKEFYDAEPNAKELISQKARQIYNDWVGPYAAVKD